MWEIILGTGQPLQSNEGNNVESARSYSLLFCLTATSGYSHAAVDPGFWTLDPGPYSLVIAQHTVLEILFDDINHYLGCYITEESLTCTHNNSHSQHHHIMCMKVICVTLLEVEATRLVRYLFLHNKSWKPFHVSFSFFSSYSSHCTDLSDHRF